MGFMNLSKGEIGNNDLCPGECEGCPFNHLDLKGVENCSLILKKFEEESPEELDIEFPTPKERLSLDEMIMRYGIFVIEFSTKSIKHDQRVKK